MGYGDEVEDGFVALDRIRGGGMESVYVEELSLGEEDGRMRERERGCRNPLGREGGK